MIHRVLQIAATVIGIISVAFFFVSAIAAVFISGEEEFDGS